MSGVNAGSVLRILEMKSEKKKGKHDGRISLKRVTKPSFFTAKVEKIEDGMCEVKFGDYKDGKFVPTLKGKKDYFPVECLVNSAYAKIIGYEQPL